MDDSQDGICEICEEDIILLDDNGYRCTSCDLLVCQSCHSKLFCFDCEDWGDDPLCKECCYEYQKENK